MSKESIISNINANVNTNGVQYITGERLNGVLIEMVDSSLLFDSPNEITNDFRLASGGTEYIFLEDNSFNSKSNIGQWVISLGGLEINNNEVLTRFSTNLIQFDKVKLNAFPDNDSNLMLPTVGLTQRNISVGTRLNGQTYYANVNGIVDLGTIELPSNTFVPINGNMTINGIKTFLNSPIVPNATFENRAVNLGQVNDILLNGDFVNKNTSNEITDYFSLINSLEQTYNFSDGLGISTQEGDFAAVSLDRFISDISGNVLELSRDRLQFNQVNISVDNSQQSNLMLPTVGLTQRNISVGTIVNGETYFADQDGLVDLGSISGGNEQIEVHDLITTPEFQAELTSNNCQINYAVAIKQGKELTVSFQIRKDNTNSLMILRNDLNVLFRLPDEIINTIDSTLVSYIPQLKLFCSDYKTEGVQKLMYLDFHNNIIVQPEQMFINDEFVSFTNQIKILE